MIEATLGVSGPAMDPRRGEYADFPATSGDHDARDGQPDGDAPEPQPDERPARRPKRST